MKTAAVPIAVLVLVAGTAAAVAQTPARPAIAFVNVQVISMAGEEVEPGQTVVVQGDRIVAVGPSGPPPDAVVIDGTGRFLLPGLTDSHVHLTTDMPWAPARADFGDAPLYLASGVTTVVNLRGAAAQLEWRRRIEAGELPGPTIYTSGEFVNEPRVRTPDDVRREVETQARDGYHLIKFHEIWTPDAGFQTGPGLPRDSYLAMFEAARREGLPVVGHAPVGLGLDSLLASSGGAVAHVGELVRLHFRRPLWTFLAEIAAAAALLLITAAWAVAALVRGRRGAAGASRSLSRIKVLGAAVVATYLAAFVVGSLAGIGGQFFDRAGWRLAFVVLLGGLIVLSLLTSFGGSRVFLDRTLPLRSRLPVMAAALASAVLAYTSAVHTIPSVRRTGDSGQARLAAQLREAGISVQTTLVVYELAAGPDAAARVVGDPAFASLLPQTRSRWRRFADRPRPGVLMQLIDVPPRYAEFTQTIAGSLHRHGVRLVAGTDAMGLPLALPGRSLLRELHLLQQSGLTPYQAIRTATVNAAAFLGREQEFGTIRTGTRADLVLLERNPLLDLSALDQPAGVMVRGQWLPRERLQQLMKELQ